MVIFKMMMTWALTMMTVCYTDDIPHYLFIISIDDDIIIINEGSDWLMTDTVLLYRWYVDDSRPGIDGAVADDRRKRSSGGISGEWRPWLTAGLLFTDTNNDIYINMIFSIKWRGIDPSPMTAGHCVWPVILHWWPVEAYYYYWLFPLLILTATWY